MKVRIRNRKTKDMGMADCRCCSRLSWRECKIDKQVFKEALEEVHMSTLAE